MTDQERAENNDRWNLCRYIDGYSYPKWFRIFRMIVGFKDRHRQMQNSIALITLITITAIVYNYNGMTLFVWVGVMIYSGFIFGAFIFGLVHQMIVKRTLKQLASRRYEEKMTEEARMKWIVFTMNANDWNVEIK